jgi:hypothetical protein
MLGDCAAMGKDFSFQVPAPTYVKTQIPGSKNYLLDTAGLAPRRLFTYWDNFSLRSAILLAQS